MTDLIALADRCEAAEGADYCISQLIGDAVGATKEYQYPTSQIPAHRNYTASLDAAMTLAPRGSAALVLKQANEACLRAVAFRSDDFLRQLPCFVSAAALRARASMETPK
jgi:hypothetical protein